MLRFVTEQYQPLRPDLWWPVKGLVGHRSRRYQRVLERAVQLMASIGVLQVGYVVAEPFDANSNSLLSLQPWRAWDIYMRKPLTLDDFHYSSSINTREEQVRVQTAIAIGLGYDAHMLEEWRSWLDWFDSTGAGAMPCINVSTPAIGQGPDSDVILIDTLSAREARRLRIEAQFANSCLAVHPDHLTAEQVRKLLFDLSNMEFAELAASVTGSFDHYALLRRLLKGGVLMDI